MNKKTVLLAWVSVLLLSGYIQVASAVIPRTHHAINATISEPETVDPAWLYDTASATLAQNVYDTLIFFYVDRTLPPEEQGKTGVFVPSLATEWTVSADLMTYTFKIREGVKWHDPAYGTLTPRDVEYTLERWMVQDRSGGPTWMILEPLLGVYHTEVTAEFAARIDAAVESDATTVTLNLASPFPSMIVFQTFAQSWAGILSEDWVTDQGGFPGFDDTGYDPAVWGIWHDPEVSELDEPVPVMMGTGPYMLDYWDKGVEWSIVWFPDHWQGWPAPLPCQGSDYAEGWFKRVTTKFIPEWSKRKMMFLCGDVDFVYVSLLQAIQTQILTIRPNAQGTSTQWSSHPLVYPDNWKSVDEESPDGDTTYVYVSTSLREDSYNLQDHKPMTPITNVRVTICAKLIVPIGAVADDQIHIKLVIDGESYYAPEPHTLTTEYAYYSSDWAKNPKTGADWTWSDINALEAGFKSIKVGYLPDGWRVTQLYVDVTYMSLILNWPEQPEIYAPGIRCFKDLSLLVVSPVLFFNFEVSTESPYLGPGFDRANPYMIAEDRIPVDFFSDINVRKAFAYAFDYDTYLRDVYMGEAKRQYVCIPEPLPYFNPAQTGYDFNLALAEEHLRAAWGGEIWEKGFTMGIAYNTRNVPRMIASEMIEAAIEGLNPKFHIDVYEVPWPTYLKQLVSFELTAFIIGWLADYPDPHNFVFPFMHTYGTFTYFQRYSNPTVDELIELGIATPDGPEREAIYYELQRLYVEDVPSVPLAYPVGRHWERDWVMGWYYNAIYPGGFYYHYWKGYRGDNDRDYDVDLDDLYLVLIHYCESVPPAPPEVDWDKDGHVDLDDLFDVLINYGK